MPEGMRKKLWASPSMGMETGLRAPTMVGIAPFVALAGAAQLSHRSAASGSKDQAEDLMSGAPYPLAEVR